MVRGRNIETGKLDTVRITPEGVGEGSEIWQGVYNPSFDVTPAELISACIPNLIPDSVYLRTDGSRLRGHGEGGCGAQRGREGD